MWVCVYVTCVYIAHCYPNCPNIAMVINSMWTIDIKKMLEIPLVLNHTKRVQHCLRLSDCSLDTILWNTYCAIPSCTWAAVLYQHIYTKCLFQQEGSQEPMKCFSLVAGLSCNALYSSIIYISCYNFSVLKGVHVILYI